MDPTFFPLVTAIIAVGGVISGTLLGSKLGENRERRSWLRDQRGKTYLDAIRFARMLRKQQQHYERTMWAEDHPDGRAEPPMMDEDEQELIISRLHLYSTEQLQEKWNMILVEQHKVRQARTQLRIHGESTDFEPAKERFDAAIRDFSASARLAMSEEKPRSRKLMHRITHRDEH